MCVHVHSHILIPTAFHLSELDTASPVLVGRTSWRFLVVVSRAVSRIALVMTHIRRLVAPLGPTLNP